MIPKVAHFHWTGREMSAIRRRCIETFEVLNPTWKVEIIDTESHIVQHDLIPAQQGDWTRFHRLYEHGGFTFASDVIWLQPIPESWVDADLNVSTDGTRVHHMAAMGALKGSKLFRRCCELCEELALRYEGRPPSYQQMGVELLYQLFIELGGIDLFSQPKESLCSVPWNEALRFWQRDDSWSHPRQIGLHWYGGAESSKKFEYDPPKDALILRLLDEVLREQPSLQ